jgi:HlyD family secretion protein
MAWILNLLRKLTKKKGFWIILVLVLGVIMLVFYFARPKAPVYVTEKVQKGNLVQTVSETGAIESASALDLNFKSAGILAENKVKEGDVVKAGDVLARLDGGSLEISVRQAQANLNMASANLDKLLAGASAEDLKVTEETVNNAKIAYDNAQSNYDTSLEKIEADLKIYQQEVDAAQINLTNTQNTYANSAVDSRQTLITTLRSKMNAANTSLDLIYYKYVDLARILDTASKANAFDYYTYAVTDKKVADDILKKTDVSLTDADLNTASTSALSALDKINTSLNYLYNAVSSALIDSTYSQTLLDTNRAAIKTEQATNSANLSALQSAVQAYQSAQLGSTSAIDTAKASLTSAQNTLSSTLANKQVLLAQAKASLDSASGAYNLAKAQYDLKKAKPRSVDIASLQAQVDQAQAAYQLALKNLDDYAIYAPTDGVITFVNYKVGEQITPTAAKPVIAMMGQGDFQINVDVPESDIVKIQIGDPANITLDAFGSDQVFKGKVVYIDVAETVIQDVVYYKITVQLDPTDQAIKSGMTANIDLITATTENVLYVSNRVIKQDPNGQKYVEVLGFGNIDSRVDVQIGLKGDTGTEIKSGLKQGQDVIVSKK